MDQGIRGVTANPTIFAKAIEASDAYDDQFATLTAGGRSVVDAYWDLVIDDLRQALAILRPVFDVSGGLDGFVSIEVAPELARDTAGTVSAAYLAGLDQYAGAGGDLAGVQASLRSS